MFREMTERYFINVNLFIYLFLKILVIFSVISVFVLVSNTKCLGLVSILSGHDNVLVLVSWSRLVPSWLQHKRAHSCAAALHKRQVRQQVSDCNGTSVQLQAVGCLLAKQPVELSPRLLLADYLTAICRWGSKDARRDVCLQNRKLLRDWRLSHSDTGFASGKCQHLSEEEEKKKPLHLVLSVTLHIR